MYDLLIVGSGLFGATFARLAFNSGYNVKVIEKRSHIAGNCYTENKEGINVHVYGPHIFHCNDPFIWDFVNQFANFNSFKNSPIALSNGKAFSLPFSMYTFNQMWGTTSPEDAFKIIESQRVHYENGPSNLEEQALSLVGRDIYEALIKDYTKKQWQRDPKDLPVSIIKRLPVRFTWDNNYYNSRYQGIPIGGYTKMFEAMLDGICVDTSVDYFADRELYNNMAKTVVFTGRIDEYFEYKYGELSYRTLRFEHQTYNVSNHQGNAVINYSDSSVPWTRIIEHKFFEPDIDTGTTIVTKEIPDVWSADKIPYYPVGDDINQDLYSKYKKLADQTSDVIFGGRLAEYRYYDMHQVIGSAMAKFKKFHGSTYE